VHRQQFDGGGPERVQVRNDGRVGQAGVGAALGLRDVRVQSGVSPDVDLVDDEPVPGVGRADVARPVEAGRARVGRGVRDDAARPAARAGGGHRARVRVQQQVPETAPGTSGAGVHPYPVERACRDAGCRTPPPPVAHGRQLDAPLRRRVARPVRVRQAQRDPGSVRRPDGDGQRAVGTQQRDVGLVTVREHRLRRHVRQCT